QSPGPLELNKSSRAATRPREYRPVPPLRWGSVRRRGTLRQLRRISVVISSSQYDVRKATAFSRQFSSAIAILKARSLPDCTRCLQNGFTEVPFCLTAQVSTAVYDKRTEITVYVFSDG